MTKESKLHKAIQDYWAEKKRKQRDKEKEIAEKFNFEANPGETYSEFKCRIGNNKD